jgi:hypothetical protein
MSFSSPIRRITVWRLFPMSVGYQDPTRHLTGVLAPIEKRTLVWLAERMPRRINSDHLTILALVAMLGAGLSYWWPASTRWGSWPRPSVWP